MSFLFHESLPTRISAAGRGDVQVLDCPVSGGVKGATEGTLTILASGPELALQACTEVLNSMSKKLYMLPGGAGVASKLKMVNQLVVGCNIAAAAEAIAFAEKAGLDSRHVYDIVVKSPGHSWAFGDRVPHMLDSDWTPKSAVDIFVKDMVSRSMIGATHADQSDRAS